MLQGHRRLLRAGPAGIVPGVVITRRTRRFGANAPVFDGLLQHLSRQAGLFQQSRQFGILLHQLLQMLQQTKSVLLRQRRRCALPLRHRTVYVKNNRVVITDLGQCDLCLLRCGGIFGQRDGSNPLQVQRQLLMAGIPLHVAGQHKGRVPQIRERRILYTGSCRQIVLRIIYRDGKRAGHDLSALIGFLGIVFICQLKTEDLAVPFDTEQPLPGRFAGRNQRSADQFLVIRRQ